jgi:hypothetical protein
MNVKRYLVVLLLGSVAGVVWATVFVDFVPGWFERLGTVPAVSLLLVPLALSFACGMALDWWRLGACMTYAVVVLAWLIPGQIRNELAHVGNLSHCPASWEVGMWLAEIALIVACWNMGRFARRGLNGEFRHGG